MKYYNANASILAFDDPQHLAEDNPAAPFYYDAENKIKLYNLDTFSFFDNIPNDCVDLIFADPPYFLSSGGITCRNGKKQIVNKGTWDTSRKIEEVHAYNKKWLSESKRILKKNGTIWVCGTFHNIFSVGLALQELDFKILNNIVWEKKDPPPNITGKYFVHASEHLVWAAKTRNSKHLFHHEMAVDGSTGETMKSVWRDIWKLPSVRSSEKFYGKHPTQKPEEVVRRAVIVSSNPGDVVFDPFCGSGTTAVVCRKLKRRCVGIDNSIEYLNIARRRLMALDKTPESKNHPQGV